MKLFSLSCLRNFIFVVCQIGHETQLIRTGLTRIPMSKSLKAGKAASPGISSGVKLESRMESQSVRIEVKKSTVNSNILQNGGKT